MTVCFLNLTCTASPVLTTGHERRRKMQTLATPLSRYPVMMLGLSGNKNAIKLCLITLALSTQNLTQMTLTYLISPCEYPVLRCCLLPKFRNFSVNIWECRIFKQSARQNTVSMYKTLCCYSESAIHLVTVSWHAIH